MHISYNWLKELVAFELAPDALADALTSVGFEVEDIEDRRTWADGVVVGYIRKAEPHPNADRLQVCQVDVGQSEALTIVCGAANARAGITVAVALPGTYLPAIDLKLRRTKLRGVASEGMICSLSELNLTKTAEGIHEFSEAHPIGTDVRPLLGLDDVILDVTSTANRADALSMVGIAREVAAIVGSDVALPTAPALDLKPTLPLKVEQGCPAYSSTLIRGVTVKPSPLWLQRRLTAAGIRSINNIVDITNLILLEWGQPLHAFDWQRLQVVANSSEPILGVRRAQAAETLTTLDGQVRQLHTDNLLITANDVPVALAGVMGGDRTEVSDPSVDILLEAALFEPIAIRRSARAQSLRTEASARYERGVDPSAWLLARDRAVALILALAGGEVLAEGQHDGRATTAVPVRLRLSKLTGLLGDDDIEPAQIESILSSLGFELTTVASNDDETEWQVIVPPYRRRDVEREVDLIEEFARLYGYDRFPETLPLESEVGDLSDEISLTRQVRSALRGVGLTELMHISLCSAATGVPVVISNPLATEFSALRQELLPGLIDAYSYNQDQGNGALWGFEVGRVFWRAEDEYQEADHLGGILGGNPARNDWQHEAKPLDWYGAKGLLEQVFERLGLAVEYQPDRRHASFHPGRTASLWIAGVRLGTFGQLHPQLHRDRDWSDPVYAFEWDLDVLLNGLTDHGLTQYQPFSTFPASDRDIAFFCDRDTSVAQLERAMTSAAGELLQSVTLFDQYLGQGVPAGQRSLAFRLIYRATDRTLTDTEVETAQQQVRDHLQEHFRVTLRS